MIRLALVLVCLGFVQPAVHAEGPPAPIRLAAQDGVVEFTAATNVSALTVHGQSRSLQASALYGRRGQRVLLKELQARVAVNELATGMSIRDKHMRERIFTRPDGSSPDLTFLAADAACAVGPAPCPTTGTLSIRGEARPFTVSIVVESAGDQEVKLSGDGTVKLSDYGIEAPKQFGVSVGDTVKIRFELVGRPTRVARP